MNTRILIRFAQWCRSSSHLGVISSSFDRNLCVEAVQILRAVRNCARTKVFDARGSAHKNTPFKCALKIQRQEGGKNLCAKALIGLDHTTGSTGGFDLFNSFSRN